MCNHLILIILFENGTHAHKKHVNTLLRCIGKNFINVQQTFLFIHILHILPLCVIVQCTCVDMHSRAMQKENIIFVCLKIKTSKLASSVICNLLVMQFAGQWCAQLVK